MKTAKTTTTKKRLTDKQRFLSCLVKIQAEQARTLGIGPQTNGEWEERLNGFFQGCKTMEDCLRYWSQQEMRAGMMGVVVSVPPPPEEEPDTSNLN